MSELIKLIAIWINNNFPKLEPIKVPVKQLKPWERQNGHKRN